MRGRSGAGASGPADAPAHRRTGGPARRTVLASYWLDQLPLGVWKEWSATGARVGHYRSTLQSSYSLWTHVHVADTPHIEYGFTAYDEHVHG